MDLRIALQETLKKKEELTEMAALYQQAILTEDSLKGATKKLADIEKRIAGAERDTAKWDKAKVTAKQAFNETTSSLSEVKREAREAISAEKNKIVKEKAIEIEGLSTKSAGKEANLIVLESRENELKASISRMEVTIEDQYNKFMKTKVG